MAKKTKASQARRRPGTVPGRPRTAVRAGTPVRDLGPAEVSDVDVAAQGGAGAAEVAAETEDDNLTETGVVEAVRAMPSVAAVPSAPARRVGRLDPATRRPAARPARTSAGLAAATVASLDPDDASVPLATVPYAVSDLRRVGIIAAFMVLLIVVAAVIVNVAVK